MNTIEKFKICSALSFDRFDDVIGSPNPYEPLFHTKTGDHVRMNSSEPHYGVGYNEYSDRSLFFIFDPSHLIKKLRNNIYNSGDKDEQERDLQESYF